MKEGESDIYMLFISRKQEYNTAVLYIEGIKSNQTLALIIGITIFM